MSAGTNRLDIFKDAFAGINTKNRKDLLPGEGSKQVNANIKAINDLLLDLMGPENRDILTEQAKVDSEKPVLKTYNTRTAFTEIDINGVRVWAPYMTPEQISEYNSWSDQDSSASGIVAFQSLDLSANMGGVVGTVTGTLSLYAREPLKLMSILAASYVHEQMFAEPNIPVIHISMGWMVEDEFGKVRKITTKTGLPFLANNILMEEDSNSQGATFTISLIDAGIAILSNTGSSLALQPDYPQEQLRKILETMIGVRLFTLDDLLLLATGGKYDRTFFRTSISSAKRLNSNCLINIVEQLVSEIRCSWVPEANTNLDDAISANSTAINDIADFKRKMRNAASAEKATLENKITETWANVANSCRLVWVPYFPAGIETSSNQYYVSTWEFPGAFILIPELADSAITGQPISMIYGPGGSRAPYFHGSAMNLQQVALRASNKGNFTFGDVLGLSMAQTPIINYLAGMSEENMGYIEQGKRIQVGNQVARDIEKAMKEQDAKLAAKSKGAAAESAADDLNKTTRKAKDFRTLSVDKSNKYGWTGNIAMRKVIIGESLVAASRQNPPTTPGAGAGTAKSVALQKLTSRLNQFVVMPGVNISMTVLGDPFLLRQGQGAFEVLSYMPSQNGATQILNPMITGVYFPQTITHRIQGGDYTTTIQAFKLPVQDLTWTKSLTKFIADTNSDLANQTLTPEDPAYVDAATAQVVRANIFNIDLSKGKENTFLFAEGTRGSIDGYDVAESDSKTLGDMLDYLDNNGLFNTPEE